mmetsp:Transcript_39868/g.73554  ORF Transcript_39868/g.73554 Transcript_39868/m.73554 type:complete len:234 (+) Transcript_39868:468-1169(+)
MHHLFRPRQLRCQLFHRQQVLRCLHRRSPLLLRPLLNSRLTTLRQGRLRLRLLQVVRLPLTPGTTHLPAPFHWRMHQPTRQGSRHLQEATAAAKLKRPRTLSHKRWEGHPSLIIGGRFHKLLWGPQIKSKPMKRFSLTRAPFLLQLGGVVDVQMRLALPPMWMAGHLLRRSVGGLHPCKLLARNSLNTVRSLQRPLMELAWCPTMADLRVLGHLCLLLQWQLLTTGMSRPLQF